MAMSKSIYQGMCLCEGVGFTVQGKPEKVFACYCRDCQKNAGGPVQMSAKFPKEDVRVEKGEEFIGGWLVPMTISGFEKYKVFCKRCGCTLWTIPMSQGGSHYIVRTALLEEGLQTFKPVMEFFTKMKPDYVTCVEGAKSYETMPGR